MAEPAAMLVQLQDRVAAGKPAALLLTGDCVVELKKLPENSLDACVCDPPYELGLMGKAWDSSGVAFQPKTWAEVLRVLKPGGHLLAFGGTRTYHRLTCAIEDAGFEIRDCIGFAWVYATGFPKSLDVSKAIDKAAGAEREVVGVHHRHGGGSAVSGSMIGHLGTGSELPLTAPATALAKQWAGWGTTLKPAFEPVVMARKPLIGTVAANVLAHGTGAINIEACRIPGNPRATGTVNPHAESGVNGIFGADRRTNRQQTYDANLPSGRFPANVILDEEAGKLLDEQTSGVVHSAGKARSADEGSHAGSDGDDGLIYAKGLGQAAPRFGDSGGASRFFYCAKTSKSERNFGLPEGQTNNHPTVKPINLMRYLVKLVTPPGGIVLDPFMGSGSTGIAAIREHFGFIGIEREPAYMTIAKARVQNAIAEEKVKF